MNAKRVSVRRGDLVCIHDGNGSVVAVARGTVWLTQNDDRRDVVVEAGGSFRLDRAGLAVISAPAGADLVVTAAAGTSLLAIETSSRAARDRARAALAHEF
jgi:hypothetical protein